MRVRIGVLALQGAFAKHVEVLHRLNVDAIPLKYAQELVDCDGLIIPGGESTTIFRQIASNNLEQPIKDFAREKPIFGTCAGLILLSHEIIADSMQPFNVLDIGVERNAFGRQAESFSVVIPTHLGKGANEVPALFIRAPRIRRIGKSVKVLATFENEPVLIQQGYHLGATFHPELTDNSSIHRHFISLIKENFK